MLGQLLLAGGNNRNIIEDEDLESSVISDVSYPDDAIPDEKKKDISKI
jgi:hypothetical protein